MKKELMARMPTILRGLGLAEDLVAGAGAMADEKASEATGVLPNKG
jgi:hypothetical protein